jgi:hypothetical protein
MYAPLFSFAYGIFDPGTQDAVFDYDSFVDCKVEGKMKVSDFPVEEGAFATYNKVRHPYVIKVRLAITDYLLRRNAFLHALDTVMKSTRLMDISTQNGVYLNLTLDAYSYSLTKEGGVGKILAELSFIEVRTVKPAYANAKVPGAGASKGAGAVFPKVNIFLEEPDNVAGVAAKLRSANVQGKLPTGANAASPATSAPSKATTSPAGSVAAPAENIAPSVR